MPVQAHNVKVDPTAFSGVVGVEAEPGRIGVIGSSIAEKAFGFLAGNDLVFNQHAGVYGESDQAGIFGNSADDTGTGVFGRGGGAHGFGVRGEAIDGISVQGQSFGNGLAGKFIGNVEVTGELRVNQLKVNGSDPQQRIADLEALVSKLLSFMDRTNEKPPPFPLVNNPQPTLELIENFLTGDGFLPNTAITIRLATDRGFKDEKKLGFLTNTNGSFEQTKLERIFESHNLGGRLRIAATDGRPNPFDWTGVLWAFAGDFVGVDPFKLA